MSPEERERLMSQVFSQLLTMSREQVVSTLVEFLKQLSAAANDEQYKEVCKGSAFIVTISRSASPPLSPSPRLG
jgi:hypothetical protein